MTTADATRVFEGILTKRATGLVVGWILTVAVLYLAYWVLVDGLDLRRAKAALVLPIATAWMVAYGLSPPVPSGEAVATRQASISPTTLARYIRAEWIAFVPTTVACGLLLAAGVRAPMRSQLQDVEVRGDQAQLTFRRELDETPDFITGAGLAAIMVLSGMAFFSAAGAIRGTKIRSIVASID